MSKTINSAIGRAMSSVKAANKVDDEFAAECFRAATRWLNQARAAEAQDNPGLMRHCLKMATMQARKAVSHRRGEWIFWG